MHLPLLIPAMLLWLAPVSATPIYYTFSGDIGTFTLSVDKTVQPMDLEDVNEASGDFISKREDYRINTVDYFSVEYGGLMGFGYDWYLERYPQGFGILDEYGQLQMNGLQENLLFEGARSNQWDLGSGFSGIHSKDGVEQSGYMTITRVSDSPAARPIPEPSTFALLAFGLAGIFLRFRTGFKRPF